MRQLANILVALDTLMSGGVQLSIASPMCVHNSCAAGNVDGMMHQRPKRGYLPCLRNNLMHKSSVDFAAPSCAEEGTRYHCLYNAKEGKQGMGISIN